MNTTLDKIKIIVEEAIDYNDKFQSLPWRKVREIYDLIVGKPIGLSMAIRELYDIKREERD